MAKVSGPIDETRALEIGKNLGADYVIFGSLTMAGAGASIDLRVADLGKKQAGEKFFTETKGMDEVIPRMNDLIEDLNEKIFERPRIATGGRQRADGASGGLRRGRSRGKSAHCLKGFHPKAIIPSDHHERQRF